MPGPEGRRCRSWGWGGGGGGEEGGAGGTEDGGRGIVRAFLLSGTYYCWRHPTVDSRVGTGTSLGFDRTSPRRDRDLRYPRPATDRLETCSRPETCSTLSPRPDFCRRHDVADESTGGGDNRRNCSRPCRDLVETLSRPCRDMVETGLEPVSVWSMYGLAAPLSTVGCRQQYSTAQRWNLKQNRGSQNRSVLITSPSTSSRGRRSPS